MSHCIGAILSPLNHQYCRSTTYRFLVSSLFLVQELVALVLAVAVESSDYILLLIYEHSLLQLVDQLVFLLLVVQLDSLVLELELDSQALQLVFLVEEPALVVVVQLVFL
ncbi:Uncharacterised protein [Streptococcus pneumoniae]|nr:Uncharacterised protein [Streptococcus pneumoniae]CAG5674184.1 Uncharacterised protein [Streptococcus pneumoniae]VRJ04949.1 Uncharacterised protein [Streptococcus pneumoniae]